MKIFDATQIKEWEAFTIKEQNILSIDLMERAAHACFTWLNTHKLTDRHIHIFCGKGNNGGDGISLARILIQNNIEVTVYILETGKIGTPDFQENLHKLHSHTKNIHFIQEGFIDPVIAKEDIILDALFGIGLNKPLYGTGKILVEFINRTENRVIALDIPSGLFADQSSKGNTAISATHTLSFQNYKAAFLFPENEQFIGAIHLLNIGLSSHFENNYPASWELPDQELIKALIKPRNIFSHKGNFGHAALVAGSYGMMGAAVLSSKACMLSGTGKLTVHIPSCGFEIIQSTLPEAMCKVSGEYHPESIEHLDHYDAIGIGPGIGLQNTTPALLRTIFRDHPSGLLLDADALNALADHQELLSMIPPGTVITPHIKEFERLFSRSANDFETLDLAIRKAAAHKIYIVLKGHHTAVITPAGKVYFNNTGNAGMAKAGMGDVLSGIITGLIAQHYPMPEAAVLGVYLHGLAGDLAAQKYTQQAMQAGDLIDCIREAWMILTN